MFLLFSLLLLICQTEGKYLDNVDCGSYIDYVLTDPGLYRYIPYYVKLNRCHGANLIANPQNRKCVPTNQTVVEINVIDMALTKSKILQAQNVTSCHEECILNETLCSKYQTFMPSQCMCFCNYTAPPVPTPCKLPFQWDHTACDCTCQKSAQECPKRKVFSHELCRCVCKQKINLRCAKRKQYVDEATCHCVDLPVVTKAAVSGCDKGVKSGMLVLIMLVEALALVFLYFFLYVYCYKKKFLSRTREKKYNVRCYDDDVTNNVNDRPNSPLQDSEITLDKKLSDDDSSLNNSAMSLAADGTLNRPFYYTEEEKYPLRPKEGEHYLYDVREIKSLEYESSLPPDYFDISEDGYTSVTQV